MPFQRRIEEKPRRFDVPCSTLETYPVNLDEVISLVADVVASMLDMEPHGLDLEQPFHELGMDSVIAVGLSAEFEDRLGVSLDPELALEHDSVSKISRYLHSQLQAG